MDTKRKFTLGLSYLRSAISDVDLISPIAGGALKGVFLLLSSQIRIYSSLVGGKCYNIRFR